MFGAALIAGLLVWAGPPAPRLPEGYRPAPSSRVGPELRQRADGSYEHRDRDAGFAATIHRDGSVTFRPIARIAFETPAVVDYVTRGRTKPTADERFNAVPNTQTHRGAHADTKHDPAIAYGPYGAAPILFGLGFRFGGIGDLAAKGKTSRARREFLEHTRTLRAGLRAESQREREREAIAALGEQLRSIWNDPTLDAAGRRQRLFELWDDCVEAGAAASAEDAARAEACKKARRVIEAFIRRTAPPRTRDAYAPAELERMNAARRSVTRFDPYAK